MQSLIFDFDGTLANSLELIKAAFNEVAADFSLPQITDENIELIREKSARELLELFPLSPLQQLSLTAKVHQRSSQAIKQLAIDPELKTVLQQLADRDITLGIVTSNSQTNVEAFLKHNQLSVFSFVQAEKNIFGKARTLRKCVKTHQLSHTATWYVGDEVRDIEAAHQAGLQMAAVTWGMNSEKRLTQARPEKIISRPAQLLDLIDD